MKASNDACELEPTNATWTYQDIRSTLRIHFYDAKFWFDIGFGLQETRQIVSILNYTDITHSHYPLGFLTQNMWEQNVL